MVGVCTNRSNDVDGLQAGMFEATKKAALVTALLVTSGAALAGCGGSGPRATRATPASGGTMRGDFSETTGIVGAASSSGGTGSAAGAAKAPAALSVGGGAAAEPAPTMGLRAGSVDDNARFTDYLGYRAAYVKQGLPSRKLDVSERHVFTVTAPSGRPVLGADIAIVDGNGKKLTELRTYADGRALWFPLADHVDAQDQVHAVVTKFGAREDVDIDRSQRAHTVTLDAEPAPDRPQLDLEFLVDATGSMADEIAQLKAGLDDISNRIDALPSHPDVRFALTIYRDHGDTFLTRTWNFTSDVSAFRREIDGVAADGGGDTPEDVQQGLHDALVKPQWRGPGTVKLVFLVGDAAPHLDYADDPSYVEDVQGAATTGIKIESLAASGLDDEGEYVWRQIAQATLGQFLFLTYGPDDSTTHHVSGYTADNLDDVVVHLVENELGESGSRDDPQTSESPSPSPTQ